MVDILEYTPEEENPPSLLDFLEGYPGAVKEQFMQGAKTLSRHRQDATAGPIGAAQMLYSPVAPTMEYFYDRVAHLLGPNLNKMWRAQHEAHNKFLTDHGVSTKEYQDVTRKQLRIPLAIMGSVLRGSPQWYSALRKAIKDAKQDKGPIGYWKGQIKNTPGATSESTKTGFDKRLETLYPELPEENITRDEVLGLLEPIELKRTVLGGEGYTVKHLTQEELLPFGLSGDNIWGVIDPEGNLAMNMPTGSRANVSVHHGGSQSNLDRWNRSGRPEWYYGEADAKQAARWHNRQQRPTQLMPRFADRQDLRTAGGTNYREILTQLPKRESSDYWYDRQNEYVQSLYQKYGAGWTDKATGQEMKTARSFEKKAVLAEGPNMNFYGGHWTDTGQENTLGHIRVSNITANNLKSLHSDEYQLDWWQAAEKARRREIRRLSQALDISEKEAAKQVPKDYGYITKPEEMDSDGNVIPQTGEVPDEPFKDKGWELLFKDHFMEAINDPSIEAITWTTGETQAERYSLSRLIERADFAYNLDTGKYSITTFPKGGSAPQMVEGIHEDDLPAHVGDELANRVITHIDYHGSADQYQVYNKVSNDKGGTFPTKEAAQEWLDDTYKRIRTEEKKKQFLRDTKIRKIDKEDLPTEVTKSYSGEELDVGGKFLKFIYNNKAPQFFSKLLKGFKMPPTRVGGESNGYTITHPEYGWLESDTGGPMIFLTREEARDYRDAQTGRGSNLGFPYGWSWESMTVDPVEPDEPEVWQQIITDEMREKFKEGMSLTKREETGLLGSYV